MNPLPLIVAELRRNPLGCVAVVALIAAAVALGTTISATERALRLASARAADRFDLVIGAPGSTTQLVLTTVYLQPAALELLPPGVLLDVQADPGAAAVAPIAVTDSYHGYALVGTTAAFAADAGRLGVVAGRMFDRIEEAVIGAAVDLPVGGKIRPAHGTASDNLLEAHEHGMELVVVGKLERTGTPWDRAIIVPIEAIWAMHGHPSGGQEERTPVGPDRRLGPPWTAAAVQGVPALVVKPRTVGEAYRLRQKYRGRETTALFPAEVLNQLYSILGNVRDLMRWLALAFDILLVAAVLLVIVAVLSARRQSLGVLRALGAPPSFVFVMVWVQGALLVGAGVVTGVALGAVLTRVVSAIAGDQLGLALDATIGVPELAFAAALLAGGSALAALPSLATLRVPVSRLLRLT